MSESHARLIATLELSLERIKHSDGSMLDWEKQLLIKILSMKDS